MEALAFTLQLIKINNSKQVWILWFMLAQSTISLSTKERGGVKGWHSWNQQAARRLHRWKEGDFFSLWDESVQADVRRQAREDANQNVEREVDANEEGEASDPSRRRRVERLVGMGRYSDAAQAVSAEGLTDITDEVVDILRAKFPDAWVPVAQEAPNGDITVAVEAITTLMASFQPGTSAGLSGITSDLISTDSVTPSRTAARWPVSSAQLRNCSSTGGFRLRSHLGSWVGAWFQLVSRSDPLLWCSAA